MVAHDAVATRFESSGILFTPVVPKDAAQIAAIEAASFHPDEASSQETFEDRINACPEFFLVARDGKTGAVVAFVSATLTASECLTKESMLTHDPQGSLLCIHSLAVADSHRGLGLGPKLLREFLLRVRRDARVRGVALLAHDELVGLYEKHGFRRRGLSCFSLGPRPFNEMLLAL
jgi:ribosomal protein S18 acetylase RimI-like enzyme